MTGLCWKSLMSDQYKKYAYFVKISSRQALALSQIRLINIVITKKESRNAMRQFYVRMWLLASIGMTWWHHCSVYKYYRQFKIIKDPLGILHVRQRMHLCELQAMYLWRSIILKLNLLETPHRQNIISFYD